MIEGGDVRRFIFDTIIRCSVDDYDECVSFLYNEGVQEWYTGESLLDPAKRTKHYEFIARLKDSHTQNIYFYIGSNNNYNWVRCYGYEYDQIVLTSVDFRRLYHNHNLDFSTTDYLAVLNMM